MVLVIIIASLLVIIVAYSLKEASERILVKPQPELKNLTDIQLFDWAKKQYRLMNAFLSCGLFAGVGLVILGSLPVLSLILAKRRDIIDCFLSGFGAVILAMGIYFTIIVIRELKFTLQEKNSIIDKIIEQVNQGNA